MSVDLHDSNTAFRFYEDRFSRGYMDGWPEGKRARVENLIRRLGLPSTGRALDFGCGAGVFTAVLARALPGWEVAGTDLSEAAVQKARERQPHLRFFPFSECKHHTAAYDFIFTHHVLEHVSNIQESADLLKGMLTAQGSMFHILPCGDSGSFAHGVCALRRDGIDMQRGSRFFYEEEGHLRRLDTARLVSLWSGSDFKKAAAWYAHHRWATYAWLSAGNWEDILRFADPAAAVDRRAKRRLAAMRMAFLGLWAARKPVAILRQRRVRGNGVRGYSLLAVAVACLPFAWPVDRLMSYLEEREWRRRQNDIGGAEMYVYLSRD